MDHEKVENCLKDVIESDGKRSSPAHHFHPSQVTGCPLKVHLDKMTRHETTLNSWLFQGSAVHFYLQESGILDEALRKAGFHPVTIEYEKNIKYPLTEDVWINGTCDILASDGEDRVIYDIKYSSIPVESGHGRLYKYFSQANVYAHMFGASEYGLIMINSKSQDLLRDIHVLEGDVSEENWNIVKQKAKDIKEALDVAGFNDESVNDGEGVVWDKDKLEDKGVGFWKEVMQHFDEDHIPSYNKECQYCDHKSYCPVKNNKFSNVQEMINESSD